MMILICLLCLFRQTSFGFYVLVSHATFCFVFFIILLLSISCNISCNYVCCLFIKKSKLLLYAYLFMNEWLSAVLNQLSVSHHSFLVCLFSFFAKLTIHTIFYGTVLICDHFQAFIPKIWATDLSKFQQNCPSLSWFGGFLIIKVKCLKACKLDSWFSVFFTWFIFFAQVHCACLFPHMDIKEAVYSTLFVIHTFF